MHRLAQERDSLGNGRSLDRRRLQAFAEFAPDEKGQFRAVRFGPPLPFGKLSEDPIPGIMLEQPLHPIVDGNDMEVKG